MLENDLGNDYFYFTDLEDRLDLQDALLGDRWVRKVRGAANSLGIGGGKVSLGVLFPLVIAVKFIAIADFSNYTL